MAQGLQGRVRDSRGGRTERERGVKAKKRMETREGKILRKEQARKEQAEEGEETRLA